MNKELLKIIVEETPDESLDVVISFNKINAVQLAATIDQILIEADKTHKGFRKFFLERALESAFEDEVNE